MERYFHRSTQTPVEDFFDFGTLPHNAIVVDVGGGRGHHSIRLATQYPHISFINQDLEKMTSTLTEAFNEEKLQNVTWQNHNFFHVQPTRGANLYLLSHILMDNPDRSVQAIP
jgi:sterigmatocystin 8-O-methyltransferase